jgi:CrcB protein
MRAKNERRWSSPEPSGNGLMTPGRHRRPGVFLLRATDGAVREWFQTAKNAEYGDDVRIALLIVFGSLGTLARYGLQGVVQHRTNSDFPSGTLVVNLVGCFLLGGIAQYGLMHLSIPPEWRIGITVGFFGAFTTFSSFGWETVQLLQDGEWARATTYVVASVIGGLMAVVMGMRLAERI